MLTKDRIALAVDAKDPSKAFIIADTLKNYVGSFKIGLEFITAMIVSIVTGTEEESVINLARIRKFFGAIAKKLFWDGKFNDIPNTTGEATAVLKGINPNIVNVHASSGTESVKAAVANKGGALVFGVTVLTSISDDECKSIFGDEPGAKVLKFAQLLINAGADGIICSSKELELLSQHPELDKLLKMTPGIRPLWAAANDQKRIMTPKEAMEAGADFLVIGRPITKPPEVIGGSVEAAKEIAEEMRTGLLHRFILSLFNLEKIKFGSFKLKLHEKKPEAPLSPIYLNIRELPERLYILAGDILHDLVENSNVGDFDYIIGIPNAGKPIGEALAKALQKPFLNIKKEESEDGRRITSEILDPFEKGKKVLLVDDLITKADTKREAINSISENGLEVVSTFVLVDREQGGVQELNTEGKKTFAAIKISEILDMLISKGKITEEKKKEVIDYIQNN